MATDIDGILVQWGDRLFYPSNRRGRSTSSPRLSSGQRHRAAEIRQRINATVVRRAAQVMVKVTGGGRGMAAIGAHLRYISRRGELEFEDDRGVVREGKEALHDLAEQWRYGGSFIDETSHRREAFNIMLSMKSGTDPLIVQRAAREFAQAELAGHRYVMVLHDHQANPHVHLSVRAESREGKRLNPRKADLQRWRETFAERLRGWGIDAEATRQRTRGEVRNYEPIWRIKAGLEGRLRNPTKPEKSGESGNRARDDAAEAWAQIAGGLSRSDSAEDRELGEHVDRFLSRTFGVPSSRALDLRPEPRVSVSHERPRTPHQVVREIVKSPSKPEIQR